MLKNIQQNSQCCQGGCVFCIFFVRLECVDHFAYVAHLVFLRDVRIRTHAESCRSKQVRYRLIHPSPLAQPTISLNSATHLPELSHPSSLTQPPITLIQPPISIISHPPPFISHIISLLSHVWGAGGGYPMVKTWNKGLGTSPEPYQQPTKNQEQEGTENASCAGKELVDAWQTAPTRTESIR